FLPLDIPLAATGAVIGGISSGLAALRQCEDWKHIARDAAIGAGAGLFGGFALGFGGSAVVGGFAGFAGDAITNYINTGGFNLDTSGSAGILGLLGGGLGRALSKVGVNGVENG